MMTYSTLPGELVKLVRSQRTICSHRSAYILHHYREGLYKTGVYLLRSRQMSEELASLIKACQIRIMHARTTGEYVQLLIERKKLVAQYNELYVAAAVDQVLQTKAENATKNSSCRGVVDSKDKSDEAVLATRQRTNETEKDEEPCACELADLPFVLDCTNAPLTKCAIYSEDSPMHDE